jgi:serine/threonine-protein kinase
MTQSCPHCNTVNRDTARFCSQCSQPLRQPCPQCGADNPARSRFCNKCGAPLAQKLRCPQCGWVNPSGSRFCNDCGATLAPTRPQPQPPSAPLFPPTATGTGTLPLQSVLSGRYVILRRVGKGGMGAVYQAADTRILGKTWAIKEMSDAAITNPLEKQQALAAFRQEALMLARLDHPNLPKVTDHFTEEGKQYLVMDFVEGETLAERLEREGGGPLPADEVLDWARQLCDVLEYLHSQSPPVVFRDLKPGNVMVTPEGTVKLIDFGIARLFKPGKATDTAFFGTAGYAPKEQYGKGQTDARSDVYALGATVHHLLTGKDPTDHPFDFEDIRQLDWGGPAHVADAVMKALSEDADERWQSVAEMKATLVKQPAPEPKPKPKPDQKPKHRPKVSAVPQAAAVSASAGEASAPQPIPVPLASRLNFWRGLGLTLLGAALYGGGCWLSAEIIEDYESFSLAPPAFLPALFGTLFGPWVGGFAGALGSVLFGILAQDLDSGMILVVSTFALGMLPGLMVKQARNWKAMVGVGIVASGVCAMCAATAISIVEEYWDDFWEITVQMLAWVLPANVLLLPLFARWLVGPVRRWGLHWRDLQSPRLS